MRLRVGIDTHAAEGAPGGNATYVRGLTHALLSLPDGDETYVTAMKKLADICQEVIDGYVVENVLRPLQQAIAIS